MMRFVSFIGIILCILSCQLRENGNKELSRVILSDTILYQVDEKARELISRGFYAGSGYQMVWSRDLNTFMELSCEQYNPNIIRENLLMFFDFQGENGELLDGYVPIEGFTWDDPNTYKSITAPNHIGFKNTVETDQETSLIQAIAKYIAKTNDKSILWAKVDGRTVYERLKLAINFLMTERYSEKYGLIIGATTFDWGDVQVEGGAVVDVDELTHWSIDVYDNAMFVLALKDMYSFATNPEEKEHWQAMYDNFKLNTKKHLWDCEKNKFIPHIYIEDSPFPSDFDENAIHYHGGTAVAMEAGLLTKLEIEKVIEQMKVNVKLSGAPSIGLTVYPPYPENLLGKNVSKPYDYQNGGDWTWFGGRLLQQFIDYGFVEDAYTLGRPMFERVILNNGFYEWYAIDGTPRGSADFKGSAGVLANVVKALHEWAEKNK
ncbi:GH36-type glycosyl hydrolase domain-containing protein [Snuella lapsa]